MGEEKRRRSRVCAQFDAYVYIDGEKIPVSTQNISLKGALFDPEPRLAVGRECTLVFTLAKDITVRLRGSVVRSDEEGMPPPCCPPTTIYVRRTGLFVEKVGAASAGALQGAKIPGKF